MKLKITLATGILNLLVSASAQNVQLGAATLCSGSARLDNGSVVIIGQPFAGVMSAPGNAVVLNSGIVAVLEQVRAAASVGPITPGTVLANGTFRLGFPATPGRNYVVLGSTNLTDWVPIWSTIATGPWVDFREPGVTNWQQRFYRVMGQ